MNYTLNELHELKDYFNKILLYVNENNTTKEDETLTEYGRDLKEFSRHISEIEQEINNNSLYARFAKPYYVRDILS